MERSFESGCLFSLSVKVHPGLSSVIVQKKCSLKTTREQTTCISQNLQETAVLLWSKTPPHFDIWVRGGLPVRVIGRSSSISGGHIPKTTGTFVPLIVKQALLAQFYTKTMKNDTNTQFANQQNSLMFSKIMGREFQNNDSRVFVSNQHHALDPKKA